MDSANKTDGKAAVKLTPAQRAALLYYAGREARDEAVKAGSPIPAPVGHCPELVVTRRLRARGLMEYGGPDCSLRLTDTGRELVSKVNADEACGCCEGAGVMPCACSEPCDCVGGEHECGDCGGEGTEEAAQRRFEHAREAQVWSDWGTRLAPVLTEDDAA